MASFYERVAIVRVKLMVTVTVTWTSNYYYNRSNRCDHVFSVEWNLLRHKMCELQQKHSRTRTHSNITTQRNQRNQHTHQTEIFTSNERFWHIFIRTHTFFCHRCQSPWTYSNACIARPQCVRMSVCVLSLFFCFFSFGPLLTDCSPQ